jgi:hypothetical protein
LGVQVGAVVVHIEVRVLGSLRPVWTEGSAVGVVGGAAQGPER